MGRSENIQEGVGAWVMMSKLALVSECEGRRDEERKLKM